MDPSLGKDVFSEHDEFQVRQMQKEMCISVDENDNCLGPISKLDCHLMSNINKGIIHRAFSVLIFNDKNEYLITQRSDEKILFPGVYSNACCSHPLHVSDELDSIIGAKRAAIRRMNLELGTKEDAVSPDELKLMARFMHRSPCDSTWGEYEIAYVFILLKNVKINPNPKEVQSTRYVNQEQYKQMLGNKKYKFTPWSYLIADAYLYDWWNNLNNLTALQDTKTIRRLGF